MCVCAVLVVWWLKVVVCVCCCNNSGFFFRDSEGRPAFYLFEKISVFFRYHIECDCAVSVLCVFDYIFQKTGKFFNSIEIYLE